MVENKVLQLNKMEPQLTREYVELAKKHGMNSIYLKEILLFKQQGLNNKEIANQTGISPTTIASYLDKLNMIERNEIIKITCLVLVVAAGLTVVKGFLGESP